MGKWLLWLVMAIALITAEIGAPSAGCNLSYALAYAPALGEVEDGVQGEESLSPPTASEGAQAIGLTWHGTKSLETRYITGKGNLKYQGTGLDPGFA